MVDKRYEAMKNRLSELSEFELFRIINSIDQICFDTYNYDEKENKFCPIAIALKLDRIIENPTDELIGMEIEKRFSPVNILKGVDGNFYKENRKADLLFLCSEVINEKRQKINNIYFKKESNKE